MTLPYLILWSLEALGAALRLIPERVLQEDRLEQQRQSGKSKTVVSLTVPSLVESVVPLTPQGI